MLVDRPKVSSSSTQVRETSHANYTFLGAIIPASKENELKVSCDVSFTNPANVLPEGDPISMPADVDEVAKVDVQLKLKIELDKVTRAILGNGDYSFEGCRICWYIFLSFRPIIFID